MEKYHKIHNRYCTPYYNDHVYSFVRYSSTDKLIVVVNFNTTETYGFELRIPANIISEWQLPDSEHQITDLLYGKATATLYVNNGVGNVRVDIKPLESFIFKVG